MVSCRHTIALGRHAATLLLATLLGACAQLPAYTPLPVVTYPSPNFNERKPSFVILHHTSNAEASLALATLSRPGAEVSAHYLLARDGTIFYLVDELKRAWHAGASYWGGPIDMNSASLGIEIDNDGAEPYAEVQVVALLALLSDLKMRYRIPAANFIGHGDIAPGRKVDPGVDFPWRRLAGQGFGLWCDPPFESAPPDLDPEVLLGAIGYDVADAEAAVVAFKRHFVGVESTSMDEEDRERAYCLLRLKQSRLDG